MLDRNRIELLNEESWQMMAERAPRVSVLALRQLRNLGGRSARPQTWYDRPSIRLEAKLGAVPTSGRNSTTQKRDYRLRTSALYEA